MLATLLSPLREQKGQLRPTEHTLIMFVQRADPQGVGPIRLTDKQEGFATRRH